MPCVALIFYSKNSVLYILVVCVSGLTICAGDAAEWSLLEALSCLQICSYKPYRKRSLQALMIYLSHQWAPDSMHLLLKYNKCLSPPLDHPCFHWWSFTWLLSAAPIQADLLCTPSDVYLNICLETSSQLVAANISIGFLHTWSGSEPIILTCLFVCLYMCGVFYLVITSCCCPFYWIP